MFTLYLAASSYNLCVCGMKVSMVTTVHVLYFLQWINASKVRLGGRGLNKLYTMCCKCLLSGMYQLIAKRKATGSHQMWDSSSAIIMTSQSIIRFANLNSLQCEDRAEGGIQHGGKYCVAGGPNEASCKTHQLYPWHMHVVLKDKDIKRLWTQFVRRRCGN